MNKNTKIALGVLSAFIIVGGGLCIYVSHQISNVETMINESVIKAQENLPKNAVQSNVFEKGLFSSNGIYTLEATGQKDNKPIKNKLIIAYHINHGIKTWLTFVYPITATTNIEGDIKSDITYSGNLINTTGEIFSNGDVKLNNQISSLTYSADKINSIVVSNAIQNVQYDNNTQKVRTETTIPNLLLKDGNKVWPEITFNDTVVSYDYDRKNNLIGVSNIKVKKILSNNININDASLGVSSTLSNDKYNFNFGLTVGGINIKNVTKNNSVIDLAYSIKNLDKTAIENLINFNQYLENKEKVSKNELEEKKQMIKNIMMKGLSFDIDKLILKGDFGQFAYDGKMTINPAGANEFKLLDKTSISANIKATGQIASLTNMLLYREGFLIVDDIKEINQDNTNVKINYTKDSFTINNQNYTNTKGDKNIKEVITELDNQLIFNSL